MIIQSDFIYDDEIDDKYDSSKELNADFKATLLNIKGIERQVNLSSQLSNDTPDDDYGKTIIWSVIWALFTAGQFIGVKISSKKLESNSTQYLLFYRSLFMFVVSYC